MRRAALLDAIAAGPPHLPDAGERFFCEDLLDFTSEDLRREKHRLELRLLLTDSTQRDRWPATWVAERLARVEDLLKSETIAAGWRKVRR